MNKKNQKLTISQLANLAGINLQTIYYYEDLGLLPDAERTESGYRTYDHDYLENIHFIKQAQELGFKLEEIQELVALRFNRKAVGQNVKDLIQKKICEVDCEIEKLIKIKATLETLDQSCSGEMPTSCCPILTAMKGNSCH